MIYLTAPRFPDYHARFTAMGNADIPPANSASIDTLTSHAQALGFALLGVAPARRSGRAGHIAQWLEQGNHGEMEYLARELATRLDPAVYVPGAESIIAVAALHASALPASEPTEATSSARGRVARYAWHDDYHRTIKSRLHAMADALRSQWPAETFRSCVDTAPILEREHAARAGLGWVGKHTLLIHPQLGSWFLLGQIVTTLRFDLPTPAPVTDHCGTCTRCIDACPTRCIAPEGYTLDASRCISYLTVEHRSPIDPTLHEAMGNWVAGCDICQEVCPHNRETDTDDGRDDRSATTADASPPDLPDPMRNLPLKAVIKWQAEDRTKTFRRSALKRIKLDAIRRNALIAWGNHLLASEIDLSKETTWLGSIASDPEESDLVRTTANQVLQRLEHALATPDRRTRDRDPMP